MHQIQYGPLSLCKGISAPCYLHNFPSCSLLFQIFHPLLFLNIFLASFSFSGALRSFFIILLHKFFSLIDPFQNFPLLHAPFRNFLCSLLQEYCLSAPCSFTYLPACSFLSNKFKQSMLSLLRLICIQYDMTRYQLRKWLRNKSSTSSCIPFFMLGFS